MTSVPARSGADPRRSPDRTRPGRCAAEIGKGQVCAILLGLCACGPQSSALSSRRTPTPPLSHNPVAASLSNARAVRPRTCSAPRRAAMTCVPLLPDPAHPRARVPSAWCHGALVISGSPPFLGGVWDEIPVRSPTCPCRIYPRAGPPRCSNRAAGLPSEQGKRDDPVLSLLDCRGTGDTGRRRWAIRNPRLFHPRRPGDRGETCGSILPRDRVRLGEPESRPAFVNTVALRDRRLVGPGRSASPTLTTGAWAPSHWGESTQALQLGAGGGSSRRGWSVGAHSASAWSC